MRQPAPGQREVLRAIDNPTEGARPKPLDGARARVVNRTHRIVRDQALAMRERKEKARSLWVPLAIFSTLTLSICYALWAMLDGYDVAPNGVPDASDQLSLLLVWSLPVTAVILGLIWIRRERGRANGEVPR